MNSNRLSNIASLNIIRALTSLIIVIYHSKFILWCGGKEYISKIGLCNWYDYPLFALDMLSSNGEPIVVCFFILSGVVISHSYRRSKYSILQFYTIRLTRIYIPFISSIVLSILTLIIVNKFQPEIFNNAIREYNTRLIVARDNLSINSLFNSLIFLKKNNEFIGLNFVYWSLLHEVLFYLLYPVYHLAKSKGRMLLIICLILIFALTNNQILYYQIYFLIGILIYDLFADTNKKPLYKKQYIYLISISICYLIMTITFIKHMKITADIFSTIMSLFAFDYVISYIKKPTPIINKLAEYSYTLYLNHLSILLLLYGIYHSLTNQFVFYERYFYYSGVIIALICCKMLFFSERFSLNVINKLKAYFNSK